MRNLLRDADRDRLAAPIPLLAEEIAFGGSRHLAMPETEGGAVFPASASARAAELLLMPGLREAHGAMADALLDAAMALVEAGPLRAVSGPFELRGEDPGDLDLVTPLFHLTGDLRRGVLRQAMRAAPGTALRHTGNLVEFRIGRHAACVDVEDTIVDARVERDGDRVVMWHASVVRGLAGLFAPKPVEAGRLEYRYEMRAGSPVLRLELRFTAARALTRVRLTTALDALEDEGLVASAGRMESGGAWQELAAPAAPGPGRWAQGVPVGHLAAGEAGWSTPAAHLRPEAPGRVVSVTAEARRGGAVHWLLLRHGEVDLAAGETLVVREDRLLAAGDPVAVAAMMAGGAPAGLALDPRPDPGAVVMAAAAALPAEDRAARREVLAGFVARQVAALAGSARVEELAAALVGADALRRAGLEPGADLAGLIARLGAAPPGGLGARALAMLALARAGGEAALAGPMAGVVPSAPGLAPALALDGVAVDPRADAEGVALLARAAGAVVLAAEAGAAVEPGLLAQARQLHRTGVALLRPLARPRDGRLEVHGAGGLEPGLQALVTLAFLAPERLLLAPGRVAA